MTDPSIQVDRPDLPKELNEYYDSYVELFGVMPAVPGRALR